MKTYVGRHAGAHIEDKIMGAKNAVKICSPWIGPKYARLLSRLVDNGIFVKLVTTDKPYSSAFNDEEKIHGDTLQILRQINGSAKAFFKAKDVSKERISYKIVKSGFIHAKIFLVDGKYAVAGSANFTTFGQTKNVEHLFYSEDPVEVRQIDNDFETIWSSLEVSEIVEDGASVLTSIGRKLVGR